MSQCPWVTAQCDKFLYHLQTSKFYLLSVHQCHLYIQQTRAFPGQFPGELHLAVSSILFVITHIAIIYHH